jgi:hypothetical protein
MIYLHYKDTKTFGHSFFFPLVFRALGTNCLQVGNFSNMIRLLLFMRMKFGQSYAIIVNAANKGCLFL